MASTTRQQPPWTSPSPPAGVKLPPIKIYNSLTRRKDVFVPVDPQGKSVTWYACGPTVYDDSHLGHARNYVSTDIIRRILKDYFEFDVKFVMNTTDIDDKIILRGRQQFLLASMKKDHPSVDDFVISTTKAAYEHYIKKNLPLLSAETSPENYETEVNKAYQAVFEGKSLSGGPEAPGDKEAKAKMHIRAVSSAAKTLQSASSSTATDAAEFYAGAEDVLLLYLDSLHGSSIDSSDYSIFTNLTSKFEKRFFDDMGDGLNVLYPDVLTRVTEYVPQIVSFTEKIVANGFGYVTPDGSVYFDIAAFEKAGLPYARLEPWSRNNKDLLADGEGSLASKTNVKRNDADFALWKSSKPGEPSWSSPWGQGRPGWHIECSVMASDVLGKTMDIHSGGVDLRFPHHDNELSQSEAYWCCDGPRAQWVNYFVHMGHLSIQGMKMSKSLKNYTAIKEALASGAWNYRSFRIALLLGTWQDGIEVTEELLKATAAWEDKVNNFFFKAMDVSRNPNQSGTADAAADQALLAALEKAKADLDVALCDSFNTPIAMRLISDMITEFNLAKGLSDETVLTLARWVTRLVTIFGLDKKGDLKDTKRVAWSGIEIPAEAQPFVYPVAQLRDAVRQQARSGSLDYDAVTALARSAKASEAGAAKAKPYADVLKGFQTDVKRLAEEKAPAKDILALCDQLRDTHLWNLGIYLEDRDPPLPALVRPVDKALVAERADRENAAKAKAAAKARREAEEAEKKRLQDEKAKLSHLEMFKTAEFKEWDENGIPTLAANGEEVPKSKKKKMVKEWEKQKKLHEDWLARQAK